MAFAERNGYHREQGMAPEWFAAYVRRFLTEPLVSNRRFDTSSSHFSIPRSIIS